MFFQIDFGDTLPIYDQVVRQIKFAVAGGVLKEGELVPSVRELARETDDQSEHGGQGLSPPARRRCADSGSRHRFGRRHRRKPAAAAKIASN